MSCKVAGWPGGQDTLVGRAEPSTPARIPRHSGRPPDLPDRLRRSDSRQSTGINNKKGFRWAEDIGGMTFFNTIVPPTSSQYTFAWC